MEIIRIPRVMQDTGRGHLLHGRRIGFVPTMGALHEGHLSLVRMSREENDVTVVSIFVNPLQFGPAEDLLEYPRDAEGDAEKLRHEQVDILFMPDPALVYPQGFSTRVQVGDISEKLCGAFRPGHFTGVATIVTKLLNVVSPSRAYFGQKDYQQTVAIRRMVRDLDMGVEVVLCPTIREPDGLAASSRNRHLGPEERRSASVVYRSLAQAADAIRSGIINVHDIRKRMLDTLLTEPLLREIQYCSVYHPETLDELGVIDDDALLAIAVKIGKTRLIDSMLVTRPRS